MRFGILPLFLTGLIAVAFAAWGYNQYSMRRSMEVSLNNRYQRAFYDLLTKTQNVEVLLGKGLVVNGREQSSAIFASVWQQSMMAQEDLGQLPVSPQLTGRTAKFLSQVGDYANTLIRRAGTGAAVTREEWDRLRNLYSQATILNRELHKVEARVASGGANFWEIPRAMASSKQGAPMGPPQHADFRSINREMQTYPTLVYDGPFSDHMERKSPLGLTGPDISATGARDRALALLDRSPGTTYSAKVTGLVRGKIQAYQVQINGRKAGGDERATFLISKKGGHPVLLVTGRKIGTPRISMTDAQRRAERYLTKLGLGKMRLTYSIRQNGIATFTFAGEEQGTVIYPDLVKIAVALDNGQVTGMEGSDYLMSHHTRAPLKPKITLEQARSFLSPNLKVESSRPAVIPTDGGNEKLTYEFKSTLAANTFLVYIDAATGEEAKVLQLFSSPNGTLAM